MQLFSQQKWNSLLLIPPFTKPKYEPLRSSLLISTNSPLLLPERQYSWLYPRSSGLHEAQVRVRKTRYRDHRSIQRLRSQSWEIHELMQSRYQAHLRYRWGSPWYIRSDGWEEYVWEKDIWSDPFHISPRLWWNYPSRMEKCESDWTRGKNTERINKNIWIKKWLIDLRRTVYEHWTMLSTLVYGEQNIAYKN